MAKGNVVFYHDKPNNLLRESISEEDQRKIMKYLNADNAMITHSEPGQRF